MSKAILTMHIYQLIQQTHYCLILSAALLACSVHGKPAPTSLTDTPALPGWRMDWDETAIKLYIDDRLLNEVKLTDTINGDGSGKNPFHQPQYVLLNLALGGDNGGDPGPTQFPARFAVDCVRIYQK